MTVSTPPPDSGALLMEIALQFGATLDLERLLPIVLARITDLFNAERSLFALFDESRQVTHAVVHNLEWDGLDSPLPVSQSLINEVLDKGEPVVMADANRDVELAARQSVRLLGLRFMIGVPVHGRDHILGVLYTDSRAEAVRDLTGEMQLLTALSRLVGTAVENARLFEEQRFRHVLLGKMVHDFRTPLTVMKAYGDYLNAVTEDEEVRHAAADIRVVTDQMERMMENALELSSIDGGGRNIVPTSLDLVSALPEHVRLLAAYAQARGNAIITELPADLPPIETVPDQVWIIVDNLVFNAIKHAGAGSPITIRAALRQDCGPPAARARQSNSAASLFAREARLQPTVASMFVELSVHNLGVPVPPDLLGRLFRQFVRGAHTTNGIKNTGLGLSIVDQCARHLGGVVWAESSSEAGTTFSFTLPTDVEVQQSLLSPAPGTPTWRDTMPLTPISRSPSGGLSFGADPPGAPVPPRNR